MSRYEHFDYGEEEGEEERWEEEEPVCVKAMLPKANPLMHRAEFVPIDPRTYYPAFSMRLPDALAHHHYHQDRNNMALIDESLFAHHQLR